MKNNGNANANFICQWCSWLETINLKNEENFKNIPNYRCENVFYFLQLFHWLFSYYAQLNTDKSSVKIWIELGMLVGSIEMKMYQRDPAITWQVRFLYTTLDNDAYQPDILFPVRLILPFSYNKWPYLDAVLFLHASGLPVAYQLDPINNSNVILLLQQNLSCVCLYIFTWVVGSKYYTEMRYWNWEESTQDDAKLASEKTPTERDLFTHQKLFLTSEVALGLTPRSFLFYCAPPSYRKKIRIYIVSLKMCKKPFLYFYN